jgi:predicted O-methyltransferase YrrM
MVLEKEGNRLSRVYDDLFGHSPTYGQLYYSLVKKLQPKFGLELGVDRGMSAYAYLCGCDGILVGVDLLSLDELYPDLTYNPKWLAAEFADQFIFMNGSTENVVPTLHEKYEFDYVYIDAHSNDISTFGACVARDLGLCYSLVSDKGLIVIDDYSWSRGVGDVINEFKHTHPEWVEFHFQDLGMGSHQTNAALLARYDLREVMK